MKTCSKCGLPNSQLGSWCRECKKEYSLAYYKKNRVELLAVKKEKYAENPEPLREASRAVYHADPEAAKERCKTWCRDNPLKVKAHDLKKNYGASIEDWNRLLLSQGGACAICKTVGGKKGLGLDHDHETGKFRGLLCGRCNTALGLLKDSKTLFLSALKYLTEHSPPTPQ